MHNLVKNKRKPAPKTPNIPSPQVIYCPGYVTENWLLSPTTDEPQTHHLVEIHVILLVDTNFFPSQHFNNHSFVCNSYKHPLWMAEQGKTITDGEFTKLDPFKQRWDCS